MRPRIFHAAMLLTAAKILKENESMLSGRVRFMFQPAEETFEGAKDMLANGVLEGVDAALAYHVGPGRMPVGLFMYNSGKTMMYSVDGFRITIHGGRPRRISAQFHRPNQYRCPCVPCLGIADCSGGRSRQSLCADHRQIFSRRFQPPTSSLILPSSKEPCAPMTVPAVRNWSGG
mgnify:CR=1 FL=1